MNRLALLALTVAALPAAAQDAGDGAAVFQASCAACHVDGAVEDAPPMDVMREFPPGAIVNSLVNGKMREQGSVLSEADRIAVAEFVAGRPVDRSASFFVNRCGSSGAIHPLNGPADWNGWGNGLANARFAENGGLTAADLPNLELKWAFGYADVTAPRAQPTYAGGRLYVASENGEVHSLDPKTGCTHWTFTAEVGVRTAIVVAPYTMADGIEGRAAYFGDMTANAYAVDAGSGELI